VTKCRLWRLIKFFELEVAHHFQLQAIMTGRTKWGVSTSSKLEVAHLLGTSQKQHSGKAHRGHQRRQKTNTAARGSSGINNSLIC